MRNVQSWQNQPSVISSVEYELIEVRILKEKGINLEQGKKGHDLVKWEKMYSRACPLCPK